MTRILTLLQRYPPTNLTALLNSPGRPGDACLPKVPRVLSCEEGRPTPYPMGHPGLCAQGPWGRGLPSPGHHPLPPWMPLLVSDPAGPEAGYTHSSPSPCPSAPFAATPAHVPQGLADPLVPSKVKVHLQPPSEGSPRLALVSGVAAFAQRVLDLPPATCRLSTPVHLSPGLRSLALSCWGRPSKRQT